jgi:transposase
LTAISGISAGALKKTLHASEQDRPDVKAKREAWREEQPGLDIESLVFVDESGFTTNMVRARGRCPIGQRLLARAPHGHWRTTTFIAALRRDGLDAPMTLDGPMNGETFRAWTAQFLAPVLKRGDIVVMDNLPSHKVSGIRETIEAKGALLSYLPPYSPDLNPIEQVFAKFKSALRKAAARTVTKLWREIAKTLKTFSPQECAAYLNNCGYAN